MKFNKERFNKKRIVCFSKTFGIATIITLVLLCGTWYLSEYLDNYTTSDVSFPIGMQVGDYDVYMESQKNVASDISGMSVYDKYVMGLETQEGSDSDYDGLTDKEEIEIYGTDPLAASTAGDLYSDGYKVKEGLDVFSYIEYDEEMEFPFIECNEVSIVPTTPTDFNTVVKDYTEMYSLEKYNIKNVYKGYCLYNYGGAVIIDITDILEKHDIALKNIEIYVVEGMYVMPGVTELIKCKYDEKDNKITLDYSFNSDAQYLIYITSKKQLSFNVMLEDMTDSFFFGATEDEIIEEDSFTGSAVVYGFPILEFLFGKGYSIDYVECENSEQEDVLTEDLTNYSKKLLGDTYVPTPNTFNKVNSIQLQAKQKIFDSLLSVFEFAPDEGVYSLSRLFFFYSKYEKEYASDTNSITEPSNNYGGGQFDKYVDELQFQNFESYIAPYGNCAGISHLTAYLFNKKQLPQSGYYECEINGKMQTITWDIGKDIDNVSLLNPGLSDYKSKKFVDKKSEENSNYISNNVLSESEKEFVNMIGCFWAEGNSKIDSSYLKPSGTLEDYSTLENMMAYIDEGKIVDVYMYMRYGGGHAVNIYGYEHTPYEDQTIFYIYDSNIPQDDRAGFKVDRTNGTCMLQTIKIIDKAGDEKFVYAYWPMSSHESYQATNYIGKQDWCMFVAMDENWNILN